MLRTCSLAHRSQVHTRRPASVEADQVTGRAAGATVPQVAHTGRVAGSATAGTGSTPGAYPDAGCSGITPGTYRATVGTPLSMTGRAARAQGAHVQVRRPAGSIASDQVNAVREAEAGMPQTAQEVLDVMSTTVVRHRVGLATGR
jgi:hypothetical protein